jgi:hypothetical protein
MLLEREAMGNKSPLPPQPYRSGPARHRLSHAVAVETALAQLAGYARAQHRRSLANRIPEGHHSIRTKSFCAPQAHAGVYARMSALCLRANAWCRVVAQPAEVRHFAVAYYC